MIAILFQLLAGLPVASDQSPFLPEHVAEFAMADTSWQRLLYQLALVVALALTVLSYLIPVRFRPAEPSRLVVTLLLSALILFGLFTQGSGAMVVISSSAGVIVLAGSLVLARLPRSAAKPLRWALAAGCVALLLLLVLPGLDRPIALRTVKEVTVVSVHYAGSMGSAAKLALGTPLDHIRLNYGVAPLLVGLWPGADLHRFSALYDEVLAWQLLFLAGLVACACLYDRSRSLFFPTLVGLLVAPFVSTYYRSMLYPNESGIRNIGFLVALLLLRWVEAGVKPGFGLGLAGAALIFYNPETGVVICLGFAFRQIAAGLSARRRIIGAVIYGGAFLLGLALGLAGLSALVFGVVGLNPAFISSYLTDFSAGYSGIRFRPEPWSFLMMLCGIALMLHSAARAAIGRLTAAQARRTAIAVMMLVWLAYYVNRADSWNLWSLVLLVLFAGADWISLRRWRAMVGRLQRGRLTLAAAILVGLVVPFALQNAVDTAGALSRAWPSATAEFSGVLMPETMRAELEAKTTTLRGLAAAGGRLIYLTIDPSFVELGSGIDSGLPEGDVFSDTLKPSDVQHLRREILNRNPDLLLFDSPDGESTRAFPHRLAFLQRLQAALGDAYVADRSTGGWDIWVRRAQ